MPIYGSTPYSITQKFQKMTDTRIAPQPFSAVIRLHGKELKISNIFSEEGVFLPWRSSLLPFPMDRGFVVFHYWAPAYGDRNDRCPLFLGGHHSYLGKEDIRRTRGLQLLPFQGFQVSLLSYQLPHDHRECPSPPPKRKQYGKSFQVYRQSKHCPHLRNEDAYHHIEGVLP